MSLIVIQFNGILNSNKQDAHKQVTIRNLIYYSKD